MRRSLLNQCQQTLKEKFGVSDFRPGQEKAADALLNHRDLLCILPTGAGKSLCWQLPAVMMGGLTIVVSPLIVLMHDQVRHLREKGIPCVSLDSLMMPAERQEGMRQLMQQEANILFLAPERLENREIRALCQRRPPSLLVVDEAHCIVQWGNSFRPSYQQINAFIRALPSRPTICAMTATADVRLQQGIVTSLRLFRLRKVTMSVERKNLHYSVLPTVNADAMILRILEKVPGKVVIFCQFRSRTEWLADMLTSHGYPTAAYHAGLERETRNQVMQAYLTGQIRVVAATSAFGMGVDIPDIRLVIHDHIPRSMIDYVQQAGRAGRDGQISVCLMLFTPKYLMDAHERCRRIRTQNRSLQSYRREMEREWKPLKQMLSWCLRKKCLSQGISEAFRQRSAPCGHCSVCRGKGMVMPVPNLPGMSRRQLFSWILQLHRNEVERYHPELPHTDDKVLAQMARTLCLPDSLPARESYRPYLYLFRH